MKCTIPEISWHNRESVLSIDIQPNVDEKNEFYRLATAGIDSHVLIWHLKKNDDAGPEIVADLTKHQQAVNVVRWSPLGEYLASGDDERVIFIWKLKGESEPINILDADTLNVQDKEIWMIYKILRGHSEDVYDLSWSPDSINLISASIDNTAIIWDVMNGKSQFILKEHKNYVQGVAWDPKNQFLITLSTDRYMRTYDAKTKKLLHQSGKCILPVASDSPLSGKIIRLFHDGTLHSFYRRLCFSPDGQLIIAPSGVAELKGENSKPIHTTYIYTRFDQKTPSVVLPSPDQFTTAARCCPLLFELREYDKSNPPIIDLPYRMVFAVATQSSVCLYDTQQRMPIGMISDIHYQRLTDLSWSSDGKVLVVSSADGFCTLITFSDDELGTLYTAKDGSDNENFEEMEKEKTKDKENDEQPMDTQEDVHSSGKAENLDSSVASEKSTSSDTKAKPIAFRHTPRVVNNVGAFTPPKFSITPTKDKILEIPSNIIKIDDKFEETQNKIATPISVRRQPRVLISNSPGGQKDDKIVPTSKEEKKTPGNKKQPTPIAVRRQPRVMFQAGPSPVDSTSTHDDALDAWPIDQPRPNGTNLSEKDVLIKSCDETERKSEVITTKYPDIVDSTEDIRLVYDDSSADSTIEEDVKVTPNSKTPRRVELRTISTPKSNKKLF